MPRLPDLTAARDAALAAAQAAGALLRSELLRPDGPRGPIGKCPADDEAETLIRDRLLAATPGWAFRGEETGSVGTGWPMWVVDPNDGTSAMQQGGRGAAVSIALLWDGRPVLGVILAYAPPLGGQDCFVWAQGCGPLTRNGVAIERAWADDIGPQHTILVSQAADQHSAANADWVAPARFRAMVSLAYRMALVAAGDGEVATSLGGPLSHDFAGGHALLRAVGGVVLDAEGHPVTYDARGESIAGGRLFAGNPAFAVELAMRDGAPGGSTRDADGSLVAPSAADRFDDDAVLDRARGCMLGQVAGDDLGARVEFSPARVVAAQHPAGVRDLVDGGHWRTLAGQPTDDSELALVLARTLVDRGHFDIEATARSYARWYDSDPFDMGGTTGRALGAASAAVRAGGSAATAARASANTTSQANGALMRVSPLAVWGWRQPPASLIDIAHQDATLSHPHPACGAASAAFIVATAAAIRDGLTPKATWQVATSTATTVGDNSVLAALIAAQDAAPLGADGPKMGWVLIALQNAFHQLLHAPSVEEGLARTIALGGDTDTNAAIAGALLGAVHGARAMPTRWIDRVLTCRPLDRPGVVRPRPRWCWPVDLLSVAERLVVLGRDAQSSSRVGSATAAPTNGNSAG